MNSGRLTRFHPRPSLRFQITITAICAIVPVLLAWALRGSIQSVSIFAGFAWLAGVFVAALWGGYIPGVVVVIFGYLLLPVVISYKLRPATDYGFVMRATLLGVVSLIVSWTSAVRRRTEAALAASNEDLENRVAFRTSELAATRDWLETTLASIGDAVIATNADGKLTLMNGPAERLTGWESKEVIGIPLVDVFRIVNEYTRAPVENPVNKVLKTGRIEGLANHTILIARNGEEHAIDDSAAPIHDNSGRLIGMVLVFRDVSARRAAERERERTLQEARDARAEAERQRSQIHSLFMQSPVIINIHRGKDHVFELIHPLMSPFLNQAAGAGMTAHQALPEHYRAVYIDGLDRAFQTGRPHIARETAVLLPDRAEAFFSFIHHPWRDLDGSTAGVMTLALDVTDQVRGRREMQATHERLREAAKLESLGVLAGGIAHDFNNLLVGIMGNSSLALDMLSDDNPARELLDNLVKASERAAQLTHQMLAYSGKGKFFIESLDLPLAIEELMPLITPSISRNVTLDLRLAPNLPPIEADKAQMQQLLMNLVINASEAYEGRPGVVTVSASLSQVRERQVAAILNLPQLESGSYICLEVADNGVGMSEETRSRIFDPFFTTKFTGRGLGLSAVLGIIRAHDGGLEVESDPGAGTTFRVYFHPSANASITETESGTRLDLRGEGTILIVDDEETVRSTATAALESYGYEVLAAYDGESALNIFRRRRDEISLVILDLTMPILDGEAVLERLREIDPDVKIILSSGFSAVEATRRFQGKNLSGFLQKPYAAHALGMAVKSALNAGASIQTA